VSVPSRGSRMAYQREAAGFYNAPARPLPPLRLALFCSENSPPTPSPLELMSNCNRSYIYVSTKSILLLLLGSSLDAASGRSSHGPPGIRGAWSITKPNSLYPWGAGGFDLSDGFWHRVVTSRPPLCPAPAPTKCTSLLCATGSIAIKLYTGFPSSAPSPHGYM